MLIFIKTLSGRTMQLDVETDETITNVKKKIADRGGIPPFTKMELVYSGKVLEEFFGLSHEPKRLHHYNIQRDASLHLILRLIEPTDDASATTSQRYWEKMAKRYDFDEDLYIVDPQSHFIMLRQLEQDVVQRSEYTRSGESYSTSSPFNLNWGVESLGEVVNATREIPSWLKEQIIQVVPVRQALDEPRPVLEVFWHLLKSYCILSRTVESTEQMKSKKFCTNTLSILQQHEVDSVVEINQLKLIHIDSLKTDFENTMKDILINLDKDTIPGLLSPTYRSCKNLLERLRVRRCLEKDLNPQGMLTLIRKVILLLDAAVVSYVRSHTLDFDGKGFLTLDVSEGEDWFAFTCSPTRLACLDAFIDGRKVWVFSLLNNDRDVPDRPHRTAKNGSYVLTRMQVLADIWGPVYTVPSTSGLIKHYAVSKGVICRVKKSSNSPVPGAVQCHYFSRTSFFRRRASNLFSVGEELMLAEDDLLLIGGGLRINQDCTYTLSDFKDDYASDISPLGTKESVWKLDARSLFFSFSKWIGVTVSGTQKLVPQTTLKQHILDKWSSMPSRANPGILHQYHGVEISHCTGNARRVALRQILTSNLVMSVLERQKPGWTDQPWGQAFDEALRSDERNMIFSLWGDCVSDRAQIAELLCCVLELLDGTGRDGHNFQGALLHDNEEEAVSIKPTINDWSIVLKDTHLTGAYVMINNSCLNCEVPDHSASTCHVENARTVLQTEFEADRSSERHESARHYKLKPDGDLLKKVDCGSADTTILEPTHSGPRTLISRSQDLRELYNRPMSWMSLRNNVYIRASNPSFHGRDSPKRCRAATSQSGTILPQEQDYRTASSSSFQPSATAAQAQKANNRPNSLNVVKPLADRSLPTHRALRKPKYTGELEMDAPLNLVPLRNVSTAIRAPAPTERLQPIPQDLNNTNKMPPTPSMPNVLPTFRGLKEKDGDLVMSDIYGSDIYGQDSYSNRNGVNGINTINDINDYGLDEDEADSSYSPIIFALDALNGGAGPGNPDHAI